MALTDRTLADLTITSRDLEHCCDREVHRLWVGGWWDGAFRTRALTRWPGMLSLLGAEAVLAGFVYMLSLPIGLAFAKQSSALFLALTTGVTFGVMLLWNLRMMTGVRRLATLLRLLDQVDRFNELLKGIAVLDQLAIVTSHSSQVDRATLTSILSTTRENLMQGLALAQILQANRRLLAHQAQLLTSIETNCATIQVMALQAQADDYGQVFQTSLEINQLVQSQLQP